MEEFKPITGLNIKHEFWNVTTPKLFNISFSIETQELIKKLKILCRQDGNTIHFLGTQKAMDYLTSQRESMGFHILLTLVDRNLVNYTNIKQSGDQEVLYFNNIESSPNLNEKPSLLPIYRSLAAVYHRSGGAKIADSEGRNALEDILTTPDDPSFGRALDALGEGMYTSDGKDIGAFYYQPQLVKNLFAVVHLSATYFNNSTMFHMNLKSRSVKLAYRVKSNQFDLKKLRVLDADGQIQFKGAPEEEERVFVSDRVVKLSEKSAFNFQLLNGTKKPIREYLSLGTTNNFKRFDQDESQYLNEIIINI